MLTKIGIGTLTLTGANTYSGGTNFDSGFIAVDANSALGAATGPLTFNGGGLQLLSSFNLSPGRVITLQSGGGTMTNGFENSAGITARSLTTPPLRDDFATAIAGTSAD